MHTAFYEKVLSRAGDLYVWGGQGRRAEEGYLRGRAAKYPQYFDGGRLDMMLRRASMQPGLLCFDCSGLVAWALAEAGAVKKGFDATAQGLYARYCTPIEKRELRTGDLMFRRSAAGSRMAHVGVYGPGACVEAAGGAYGVVVTPGLSGNEHTARSYVDGRLHALPDWTHYGRLTLLAGPKAEETPPAKPRFAVCTGGSVYFRKGPGTEHSKYGVVRKGDLLFAKAAVNGWCEAAAVLNGKLTLGYISEKYTGRVEWTPGSGS